MQKDFKNLVKEIETVTLITDTKRPYIMPPLPVFDDVTFDGVIMDRINNLIDIFLCQNHVKFIHPQLINIFFCGKKSSSRSRQEGLREY